MRGFENALVLALGGGGARGFAHVGVLQALEEMGIGVGAVVGVSAGAVAGAGYCLGYSPEQMRERVIAFSSSELARHPVLRLLTEERERDSHEEDSEGLAQLRQALGGGLFRGQESGGWAIAQRLGRLVSQGRLIKSLMTDSSLLGGEYFLEVASFFLPDVDMDEMKLPFACVATDVCTGEVVALESGGLRRAVAASCTIPGVGDPIEIEGRWLVDGGVGALVPTEVARALGARRVVAVSVEQNVYCERVPERAVEMVRRAGEIQGWQLTRLLLEKADLVITPAVGDVHWAEFSQAQWIMEAGREAALEMERPLRRLSRRWWWVRRPW